MLYISKIISKIAVFITVIIAVVNFISCGDDPVTVEEEFDQPRYNWNMDTIEAIIIDIWAYDTNNVYFADKYYNLIYYDGSNYNFLNYGGDINATAMEGYDNNNIFVAGINTFNGKLMLKKWNGAGFENLIVSDTIYNNTIITSVRVISPSNIWLCTTNGRVFNYNGSTFDTYYLDSASYLKPIMLDGLGNVYVAGHVFYPSQPYFDSTKVYVQKFDNGNWTNIYEETYPESMESTNINFFNAGNELVSVHIHSILKYNGNDFENILNVEQFRIYSTFFGYSTNNLLCLGAQNGFNRSFYHWNGNKWSIELGVSELFPQRIFAKNNRYFATYSDYDTYETIVYKGKKSP